MMSLSSTNGSYFTYFDDLLDLTRDDAFMKQPDLIEDDLDVTYLRLPRPKEHPAEMAPEPNISAPNPQPLHWHNHFNNSFQMYVNRNIANPPIFKPPLDLPFPNQGALAFPTRNVHEISLKRKYQDQDTKSSQQSQKRPKLENLAQRVQKFQNLNPIQKQKMLRESPFLIKEYYKGEHHDRVTEFLSSIKDELKIKLLTWMSCVGQPLIIQRTLDILWKDHSKCKTIERYLLINSDLPNTLSNLSKRLRVFEQEADKKKLILWKPSELDEKAHKGFIEFHHEARKKIQELFKRSNSVEHVNILESYLDCIIEISCCKLIENTYHEFADIKSMILKLESQERFLLLKWMLFYTGIDIIRLINFLIKYQHPSNYQLIRSMSKLTDSCEQSDLINLREVLSRKEIWAAQTFSLDKKPG